MATKSDTEFLRDKTTPNTENYLTSNYFKLLIARAPALSYYAQRVSFPEISLAQLVQPTTLSTQVSVPGNLYTFNPLSVEFIVDENLRSWREVYDWIYGLANYKTIGEQFSYKDSTSDIILQITNSAYKPKFEVTFRKAYPIGLTELPFTTVATDSVAVKVTATFKYTYYDFKELTSP